MADALLLAAAVGGLGAPPPAGAPAGGGGGEAAVPVMGRVIRGTYKNAAGERPYVLHLPEGDAPAGGWGLVVMLHGCTQDADDAARGTRLHETAARAGWMVLYPEQPAESNVKKCWNWFDRAHQGRDAGEPSIIAGLTSQVVAEYRGDGARVFLAGLSAGAAMASLVAAAYPERYAALALHSGLVYGAATSAIDAIGVMQRGVASPEAYAESAHRAMAGWARVMPTLVIHGEGDGVVAPINGAQAARQWFLTNALAMGQPLDTTSGATDRSERVEGGYLVRQQTYRAKDGTPLSRLVMVRELGHAWSGGAPEGSFTDPRGPSATAMILDFFASSAKR